MNREGAPGVAAIGWALLRVGAVAFGGLGATLALLRSALVDRQKWLAESDISEALAYTKLLPGSTGIQVVAYLGWRLRGWAGALAAAVSFIAPAAALMIAVAAASLALPDEPWIHGALGGIQVGVVGLIAAAMWRLARASARGAVLTAVLLASAALGFIVHAVAIVVGAGLVGALLYRPRGDG